MSPLDIIKEPIKDELKEFERSFHKVMKSNIPLLNIVINFIIRRKGKQMRPILVFLSAKVSGDIRPSTYIAASLIEMLHTATLIHDDVVDESYERRNYLSINALWKSKMAVLIGDYLLAQGLLLSLNQKEYDILRIVSDAVKEVSEGELVQIQQSRKLTITEDKYFEIIRKKTATLISACAESGAKSVLASDTVVKQLAQFGEKLGIAFQIKDDLLDYQLSSVAGKPSGNDIKEKKITLPLIHALQNSEIKDRKRILSLINKGKSNSAAFKSIVDFIKTNGGFDYSIQKMHEYRDQAIQILDNFPESDAKNSLKEFALFTTNRKQ
ncbi:MAG: polyprenyl synthetase family protein [Bacteroidales bacterium]|nr:polyprenyl synthetase family protein [Bacteroidales bacterium]